MRSEVAPRQGRGGGRETDWFLVLTTYRLSSATLLTERAQPMASLSGSV